MLNPASPFFRRTLRILLYSATLISPPARANCWGLFDPPVPIAAEIPRVSMAELVADPESLSEDVLGGDQIAVVVTSPGSDHLLVVDADRVAEMGADRFVAEILRIPDEMQTAGWVTRFETRFEGYADEDFFVKGLRSLWKSPKALHQIDDLFFLRFYDLRLERMAADGRRRLAVISLRQTQRPPGSLKLPKDEAVRAVKHAMSAQAPGVGGRPKSLYVDHKLWFQMPLKAKPTHVHWSIPGATSHSPTVNSASATRPWFLNQLLTTGPVRRSNGSSDAVLLPYYNLDLVKVQANGNPSGFIYEVHFEEADKNVKVSVVEETKASFAEILFLNADLNQPFLENAPPIPSKEAADETSGAGLNIRLPDLVLDTPIDKNITRQGLETTVNTISRAYPEWRAKIEALERGRRLVLFSDALVVNEKSVLPRGFVLYRGDDDQVYLISHLKKQGFRSP